MRAAGVPARVVTGYLGGEWNVVGQATWWCASPTRTPGRRCGCAGSGWTRVDPTAVVAPERLNRGVFDLLPQAFGAGERFMHGAPWLQRLLQRWDAANSWWSATRGEVRVLKPAGPAGATRHPHARCALPGLGVHGRTARVACGRGLAHGPQPPAHPPAMRSRAPTCACAASWRARALPACRTRDRWISRTASRERTRSCTPQVQALLERYAQLRYGVPTATQAREVAEFSRAVARLSLPRA